MQSGEVFGVQNVQSALLVHCTRCTLCKVHSATTAYHRKSGTIKGIVGIIHCRLIELTDRISESELTDRVDQNISPIDTIG